MKRLLPFHLKLKDNELLSSWIIRLAHAHSLHVERFRVEIFGSDIMIWNRDIDKYAVFTVYNRLSEVTGTDYCEVIKASLSSYQGIIFENIGVNNASRWLIPLGIYHRVRRRNGLMYCPKCLSDDRQPYFRKDWRLSFITVCRAHRINLRDSCPYCQSSIIPHRVDMGSRGILTNETFIYTCWHCGYDLRNTLASKEADKKLIEFQAWLEKTMSLGYVDFNANPSMHSIVFFNGFRELITGIRSKECINRLTSTLNDLGFDITHSAEAFELLDLDSRRSVLKLLSWIFKRWPENFRSLIKLGRLRYSDLKGDAVIRSYWYENIIRENDRNKSLKISNQEVQSIIKHVERADGLFSVKRSREITGRDISRKVTIQNKVTYSVFEDFMTGLDQAISIEHSEITRDELIRDKIMFACAWHLNLSLNELSALTEDVLNNDTVKDDLLSFYVAVNDKSQLMLWVSWYIKNIRNKYYENYEDNNIFISFRLLKPLKRSSISYRFNAMVKKSNLERKIKNYNYWK